MFRSALPFSSSKNLIHILFITELSFPLAPLGLVAHGVVLLDVVVEKCYHLSLLSTQLGLHGVLTGRRAVVEQVVTAE